MYTSIKFHAMLEQTSCINITKFQSSCVHEITKKNLGSTAFCVKKINIPKEFSALKFDTLRNMRYVK